MKVISINDINDAETFSLANYEKDCFEMELEKLHHDILVNFISNPLLEQYPDSVKKALTTLAQEINKLEIEPNTVLFVDNYPF